MDATPARLNIVGHASLQSLSEHLPDVLPHENERFQSVFLDDSVDHGPLMKRRLTQTHLIVFVHDSVCQWVDVLFKEFEGGALTPIKVIRRRLHHVNLCLPQLWNDHSGDLEVIRHTCPIMVIDLGTL